MTTTIFNYKTVTDALTLLKEQGYAIDYNLEENFKKLAASINNYEIDYLYRYEGFTDPADESTLYGISSNKQQKGVFLVGNLSFIEGKKREIVLALDLESKHKL